ncbi:MAG: hypothetical protein H0T42_07455, partial [Deltaproteobacteria bacterium]|nr:hypothetical protein [Deltaproteobacteria bacterium]
ASPGLGERISSGFSESIQALRDFGGWLAVTLIAFLPWLVFLIPGFVIGRRMLRRFATRLPKAIVHAPAVATVPPAGVEVSLIASNKSGS